MILTCDHWGSYIRSTVYLAIYLSTIHQLSDKKSLRIIQKKQEDPDEWWRDDVFLTEGQENLYFYARHWHFTGIFGVLTKSFMHGCAIIRASPSLPTNFTAI